jgi:hypothetical protein
MLQKGTAESCAGDVIKARETMFWENGVFVVRGGGIESDEAKQPKLQLQVLCTIGDE